LRWTIYGPRSSAKLSTLDDFLKGQGKLEEFQAIAIKEVLAWQIAEAIKANKISPSDLARKMKTSRSQIARLLDPKDGNVTLATLQRAARMGRAITTARACLRQCVIDRQEDTQHEFQNHWIR
jgi:antitoxin HicB